MFLDWLEILESQKEVRVKAKIHQARRDAIQEQLRNLFSRSKSAKSNRDKSVILQLSEKSAEAEQIEFRLERDGTLKLDAENRLHKKLKSLKNEIKELEPQVQAELRIKIDINDLEGSIEQLKAEADEEHKQIWIGIAGGPGAGKSTLVSELVKRINMYVGMCVCVCAYGRLPLQ